MDESTVIISFPFKPTTVVPSEALTINTVYGFQLRGAGAGDFGDGGDRHS